MDPVIKLYAVRKAARACERVSEARTSATQAEEQRTIALMKVFEPLLGIATEDELKQMSLEQVRRVAKRRIESGAVKVDGITPERLYSCIQLSAARRNV